MQHGLVQAWVDTFEPLPSDLELFLGLFTDPDLRVGMWLSAGVPFARPWLTLGAPLVFQVSMRRAQINSAHVMRCCIYSFDVVLWMALLLISAVVSHWVQTGTLGVNPKVAFVVCAIWGLMAVYGVFRLAAAYRLYLRFEHPRSTVIASQKIVFLFVLNVAVVLSLRY